MTNNNEKEEKETPKKDIVAEASDQYLKKSLGKISIDIVLGAKMRDLDNRLINNKK
jgi:hypothetical protein